MPREILWLVFIVLAATAAVALTRSLPFRGWLRLVLPVAGLTFVLAAAVAWDSHLSRLTATGTARARTAPRQEHPGGYVTSDHCHSCHPGEHTSWHESFHRTMTTVATPATFKAAAIPQELQLDGLSYRVERRGDEYWAEIPRLAEIQPPKAGLAIPGPESAPGVREWRRLSLITGSHHMQVYWLAADQGNLQSLFPFSWLIQEQRWVPARDTFLRDPARGHPFQHWNLTCIRCHTTAGQPRPDPGYKLFDTRVGELGIACEACHGPAEHHVRLHRNPATRYLSHASDTNDPSILNPARLAKRASAQVCGQCHGIRWIPAAENIDQVGFSYRPGHDLDRSTPIVRPSRLDLQPFLQEPLRRNPTFLQDHYWSDGEVRVSGREFNGLLDSPCFERGEMTCLSCHSMHQYSSTDDQLARHAGGNDACLQCHAGIGNDLEGHTRHMASSTGSLCYNCHMPHTTYGLLKAIRSHRISSPSIATSIATGRPNACNLCHLDRTLAWTAGHLERWYDQKPPPLTSEQNQRAAAVLDGLRGDAGQRALIAWHMGWDAARQASGSDWIAPYLAQLLVDPYSAVRFIAGRSLHTLPPYSALDYDYVGPPDQRTAAAESVRNLWTPPTPGTDGARDRSAVLLPSEGGFDDSEFRRLLSERDDRSMDLQE